MVVVGLCADMDDDLESEGRHVCAVSFTRAESALDQEVLHEVAGDRNNGRRQASTKPWIVQGPELPARPVPVQFQPDVVGAYAFGCGRAIARRIRAAHLQFCQGWWRPPPGEAQ